MGERADARRMCGSLLHRSRGNGVGRGRWRKWRRASVGDGSGAGSQKWRGAAAFQLFAPTHMGCFPLYHLYPFSDFFLSKLIDSLLVGSNLFTTRAEVLERLPREVAPSRGFHPREAFSLHASFRSSRSICPLEVVSGAGLEGQIAWRGK